MSNTNWSGLIPRFERSADSINAFGDAFEAVTQVDAANLAHEGVDRQALEALKVANIPHILTENTRYLVASTSSVWTTWNPSGSNAFTCAPNCPDGDHLLLEANIVFSSTNSPLQPGLNQGGTRVKFRFAWTHNSGASTTNSTAESGIGAGPFASNMYVRGHGSVYVACLISAADFTAPLGQVRLEFASTGASYAARSIMTVTRYRRTF